MKMKINWITFWDLQFTDLWIEDCKQLFIEKVQLNLYIMQEFLLDRDILEQEKI